MAQPKPPEIEPDAPLQPDGTHFAPVQFEEAPGRAEITPEGAWRYVPGKGEPGYDPADWA